MLRFHRSLGAEGAMRAQGARRYPRTSYTVAGFDYVIAGTAGLFAAECVGKNERLLELTSAYQKAGAIDGPLVIKIHGAFFLPAWGG